MLLDSSVVRPTNMIWPSVFSRDELRTIKAPTLLLIAEYELLYDPNATVRLAQEHMPGLEAEIVPEAHHLAQWRGRMSWTPASWPFCRRASGEPSTALARLPVNLHL